MPSMGLAPGPRTKQETTKKSAEAWEIYNNPYYQHAQQKKSSRSVSRRSQAGHGLQVHGSKGRKGSHLRGRSASPKASRKSGLGGGSMSLGGASGSGRGKQHKSGIKKSKQGKSRAITKPGMSSISASNMLELS